MVVGVGGGPTEGVLCRQDGRVVVGGLGIKGLLGDGQVVVVLADLVQTVPQTVRGEGRGGGRATAGAAAAAAAVVRGGGRRGRGEVGQGGASGTAGDFFHVVLGKIIIAAIVEEVGKPVIQGLVLRRDGAHATRKLGER